MNDDETKSSKKVYNINVFKDNNTYLGEPFTLFSSLGLYFISQNLSCFGFPCMIHYVSGGRIKKMLRRICIVLWCDVSLVTEFLITLLPFLCQVAIASFFFSMTLTLTALYVHRSIVWLVSIAKTSLAIQIFFFLQTQLYFLN